MLAEPPQYFGGEFPLPNFRAADSHWRLAYIAGAFLFSAVLGGAAGGICGRVALAFARRGASAGWLKTGLAIVGTAAAFAASFPRTLTAITVLASAAVVALGAVVGIVLGSSVVPECGDQKPMTSGWRAPDKE
jgi:hypothetical protein